MGHPHFVSSDLDVRTAVSLSTEVFRDRLERVVRRSPSEVQHHGRVVKFPLQPKQRASRDAWMQKGLSAFDATMIALDPAMRPEGGR